MYCFISHHGQIKLYMGCWILQFFLFYLSLYVFNYFCLFDLNCGQIKSSTLIWHLQVENGSLFLVLKKNIYSYLMEILQLLKLIYGCFEPSFLYFENISKSTSGLGLTELFFYYFWWEYKLVSNDAVINYTPLISKKSPLII